ncbi:putative glucan endo-1,3-beta-D-glucosidase [Helianthus annuus]|uniref:Glucan endo-1,3-beta-D-glucosidase n=1 Tax=Helianthus annuus TaxID=4232 RepID=A0A251VD89_HELAN|nr:PLASMODESMATA CALLOSE-BINDING PROTEIN 1 [Helianthus annuus]KAF5803129.1 putative glucan endo-1,3-beta-D-glucosidase [Helianthus annuus]KAJ0561144.1 putative glucan endo-1,3-beta-D-glucosidase [Helianthus annuus]KAJ0567697.1 putative glucan endo-1,3-beta-D-glucosidase [Helianthus annuus]KAJ0574192.1 putative glucan endo-1,3-beta-D-glucosidase [Helianthus annuus]KAJ0738526.1 putative glucan endo-1,3-beta-D-glucosidase [Helianthus annuus]
MAKGTYQSSLLFFLFQLLCKTVTSTDTPLPHAKDVEVVWRKEPLFPSIHRALVEYIQTEFDSIDPPTTALPSTSITNPVTTPAVNTAPGIITVPGINPATNPINPPVPITNPATNPVNPPVPITNPVTTPSTNQPTASGRGQTWCIAKNGASETALQSALDYACGIGGADCATIQQGSSCYEPATLQNHASYAFNSYYQKNPLPTSCDFGGAAAITTTNPSTGSCVYPSSSSSSSSPTPAITQTPVNPTSLPAAPATSLPTAGPTFPGIQSPPSGFSFGNPDSTGLGSFGASPPLVNKASVVSNSGLGSVVVVVFIVMFGVFGC